MRTHRWCILLLALIIVQVPEAFLGSPANCATAGEARVDLLLIVDREQQATGYIKGRLKVVFTGVTSPFEVVVRAQLVSGHGGAEQGTPAGAESKVLTVDHDGTQLIHLPGDLKLKPVFTGAWSIFVDVRSIGQTVLGGHTESLCRLTVGPETTVSVTEEPPPNEPPAGPDGSPAKVKTLPITSVASVSQGLAESFGELASVNENPLSVQVGPAGVNLPLAEGSRLEVPAGAFDESVNLTISLVDLDLWRITPEFNKARIHVIAVDKHQPRLGRPVVLETPQHPDTVIVMELLSGEWRKVVPLPGPTTRIEINHFSEAVFGVVDLPETPKKCPQDLYSPPGKAALQDLKTFPGADNFFGTDEVLNQPGDEYWAEHCEEFKSMLQEFKTEKNLVIPPLEDGGVSSGFLPRTVEKSQPSNKEIGLYLYKADVPSTMNSRLWTATERSLVKVERRIMEQSSMKGPLSPAQVLKICIQENGDNIPLGVLAAHNYLKEIAYQGREAHQDYFCSLIEDEKYVKGAFPNSPDRQSRMRQSRMRDTRRAFAKSMNKWGNLAGTLQPWRVTPLAEKGYYDKMGPIYHIFAAMTARVLGGEMLGSVAVNGESFLRQVQFLTGDKPDVPKGRADQCGIDIGDWINKSTCDVEAILHEVAAVLGWPSGPLNVGMVQKNNYTVYYWTDRSEEAITRPTLSISIVVHPSKEAARAEVDHLIESFRRRESTIGEVTVEPVFPRSRYKSWISQGSYKPSTTGWMVVERMEVAIVFDPGRGQPSNSKTAPREKRETEAVIRELGTRFEDCASK